MLSLKNNQIVDVAPLEPLTELRWIFLDGNKVVDLLPLQRMLKKDLDGARRFAPYLNLYLGGNPLSEDSKKVVEELKAAHLRINP
ncbi:hypothetical protein [Verrucomicrobium spinosum]|nr:hypothetical protein [Verrucomicrobium spinosum]